jgi:hypothetical protein
MKAVTSTGTGSPARGRSPNFPVIELGEALERARTLLQEEKLSVVPAETAVQVWGYQATSSGGRQILSALRQFELVERVGPGKVRISRNAIKLLDPTLGEKERRDLLQLCALAPRVHGRLWEEFRGALPSETTLERSLLDEHGFEPSGAHALAQQYRSTLAYAGLVGHARSVSAASLAPGDPDPTEPGSRESATRTASRSRARSEDELVVEITTLESGKAELKYPLDLTSADRRKLRRWLELQLDQLSD